LDDAPQHVQAMLERAPPGARTYDDELEDVLRRMPRTGHPVLSTLFVILIITAVLVGVGYVLLFR
jgi:hypothetical protein